MEYQNYVNNFILWFIS